MAILSKCVYALLTICCSYKGHRNKEYRVESALTSVKQRNERETREFLNVCFWYFSFFFFYRHTDEHVVSGSEDGKLYYWSLVEVYIYILYL